MKEIKITRSQDVYKGPRRMDFERANQYLQDLKKVFDDTGVKFCLFYGTLVGAVRDEDFPAFDDDVDVAIMAKDSDKINELTAKFHKLGYIVCINCVGEDKKISSFYISKKEYREKVDVYVLFSYKDKLWFPRHTVHKEYGVHYLAIPYSPKYFVNFKTIHFKGADYNVPNPPEEFLEELWGDWWRPHKGQFGIIEAERFYGKTFPPEEK